MSSLEKMIHSELMAFGVTHPTSRRILVAVAYSSTEAINAARAYWKRKGEEPRRLLTKSDVREMPHLRGVTGGRPGVREL